jgi:hypothetical protein
VTARVHGRVAAQRPSDGPGRSSRRAAEPRRGGVPSRRPGATRARWRRCRRAAVALAPPGPRTVRRAGSSPRVGCTSTTAASRASTTRCRRRSTAATGSSGPARRTSGSWSGRADLPGAVAEDRNHLDRGEVALGEHDERVV